MEWSWNTSNYSCTVCFWVSSESRDLLQGEPLYDGLLLNSCKWKWQCNTFLAPSCNPVTQRSSKVHFGRFIWSTLLCFVLRQRPCCWYSIRFGGGYFAYVAFSDATTFDLCSQLRYPSTLSYTCHGTSTPKCIVWLCTWTMSTSANDPCGGYVGPYPLILPSHLKRPVCSSCSNFHPGDCNLAWSALWTRITQ